MFKINKEEIKINGKKITLEQVKLLDKRTGQL